MRATRYDLPLALTVLMFQLGCDSPGRQYQAAVELRNVDTLRAFIARFPTHPLADSARMREVELAFQLTRDANTVPAYLSFIEEYGDEYHPAGEHQHGKGGDGLGRVPRCM